MTAPAHVRTVVLLGPAGAGRTTLVRALAAGAGPAAGRGLSCTVVEHRGVVLQLLDPTSEAGHVAGLRAADGALLVLPATGGLDPRTVLWWERCGAAELPRAVVVTQLDRPGADVDEVVALGQRLLGDDVLALQVPMHGDDDAVAGVLDLLRLQVADSSGGARVVRAPGPEHLGLVANLHADLVEAVLAGSDDASLLDRYLDDDDPDGDVLAGELAAAVRAGRVQPVLAASPLSGVGTRELLDLLVDAFPSPLDGQAPPAATPDGSPVAWLRPDHAGPLAAEILAAVDDSWLVQVRSGTLRSGALRSGTGGAWRDVAVDVPEPCPAGRVCVARADGAAVGDTLSDPQTPLQLARWDLPEPQHPVAVDDDAAELDRQVRRDPTLRLEHRGVGLLLWCLDAAHAAQVLDVADPAEAELDDVEVVLSVDVPADYVRPVLRDLARRGARVLASDEHDEHDLVTVRARVSEQALHGLAGSLAAASAGTARARRRSG